MFENGGVCKMAIVNFQQVNPPVSLWYLPLDTHCRNLQNRISMMMPRKKACCALTFILPDLVFDRSELICF